MKFRLFLIAAIAIVCVQSAQAARFRVVNKANHFFDVTAYYSGGRQLNQDVANGETSDTYDTGAHGVKKITWKGRYRGAPTFVATINMPAVLLGGRFTILDAEGNYSYEFGTGGKGSGIAEKQYN